MKNVPVHKVGCRHLAKAFRSPPRLHPSFSPRMWGDGEGELRRKFLANAHDLDTKMRGQSGPPFSFEWEVAALKLWLGLRTKGPRKPNLKGQHYYTSCEK